MKITKDKFLLSLVSIESIGIAIAQTTPLIYFFSTLLFPVYVKKIAITPILRLLLLFVALGVLLSGAWFISEFFSGDSKLVNARINFFTRQFVSLSLGIGLFLVLREVFTRLGTETVLRLTIYSIIPIMIFSLLTEIPQYLQNPSYRFKSYFSEPSHLCEYLVQIVFACVWVYFKLQYNGIKAKQLMLVLSAGLILMLFTFSATGFLRLFLLVTGIVIFEKSARLRWFFFGGCILIICILAIVLLSIENNYLIAMIYTLPENADETASFVDRFYSFVGPIGSLFNSFVGIGYGFGGDSIYYEQFYPKEFIEIVELSKKEAFGIVSFWGKVLVFTGLPGMLIWGLIILQVIKAGRSNHSLRNIYPVIFSIFLHGFIGSGAFLLIHTWFWLAFTDAFAVDSVPEQTFKTNTEVGLS